jgi:hypothetical protein
MSQLGTLLGRPGRRRGTVFAAVSMLIAATAGLFLAPARADAASQPSAGVEWYVTPGGDAGQCGNPTSSTQWAVSPDWTSPIRIDTDGRAGGCDLAFGIYDPSDVLAGLSAAYTWAVSPGGDANQCGNAGTWSMPVNTQFEQFGQVVLDDSDNRSGWCNLTFSLSGRSDVGLDLQYYADASGSANQCVNALPQGDYYTATAGSPVTLELDTDNRPGGCWLSVRVRQFSSAAAARHAAGIHRA